MMYRRESVAVRRIEDDGHSAIPLGQQSNSARYLTEQASQRIAVRSLGG
jgi:hypothetical protein